jgi:hypothetical protein
MEAVDNGTTWQEALNDVLTDNHENRRVGPRAGRHLRLRPSLDDPRVRTRTRLSGATAPPTTQRKGRRLTLNLETFSASQASKRLAPG